ncbi:endoribonuclease Dicer [Ceratobasidium sp. AG-Ba]|nr:endoribonuclease Dicer [Ceratobasidium sp. AG-Ba]QRW14991.1 endoribonuclease Dicer [Ceratobasidium sp. AG-Ba]
MANAYPQTAPSPSPEKLIPRLYQQEIFNHAVQHNVICAMDTGSGKTQIAVMLLRHVSLSFLPADVSPKKVAVFLVSSVPLVEQQADFLKSQLPLRVNKFYGAMGVDLWNREQWARAFAESDVMVMTAQVFYDLLSHAHWHISKVCLIIFDEAHHCNKKHVYAQIMRTHYFYCIPEARPRIFGMTASPIYNIRDPTRSLAQLEKRMDSKVLAVRDNTLELALNAPRPNEFLLKYTPPRLEYPDYTSPSMWLLIEEYEDLVLPDPDDVRDLRTRFCYVRDELGPLCADYFIITFLKRAIVKASTASKATEIPEVEEEGEGVTEAQTPPQSWSDLDAAHRHHSDRINELADSLDLPRMQSWFTPKLFKLIQVLEANNGADFSAMIFVEQRQIASVLAWLLPKVPQLKSWVKAAALVGHGDTGGPTYEGSGMAHAAQRAIVHEFREGKTNLVIATSVAEEGLDFQACSLVIRLDAPQTMIGYLQSRGRARKSGSNYVVLADEAGGKRYHSFREAEPDLRRIYQRIHAEEEKEESFMDTDEDDEADNQRYVVEATGAVLTPTSSISLLHLLCSLLTVDKYTKPPAPEFHVDGNYMCTVTLPPSILKPSVCGPVQGGLRKTRDGARRSAAFEMIQKLHKLEMFDDYLMPFRRNEPTAAVVAPGPSKGKVQRIGEYFETMSTWGDIWQPHSSVWMNELSFNGSDLNIALITAKPQPARDLTIYKREGPQRVKLHRSRQLEFSSEQERLELLEKMQRYTYCAIYWAITARKLPSRSTCLLIPLKGGMPDYDTMAQIDSPALKLTKEDWLDPALQGRHVMEAHRLGSQSYKLVGSKSGLGLSSTPVVLEGAESCREAEFESYRAYWEKTTNVVKRGLELEIPEDDCWLELAPTRKADFRSQGLFGLVDVPDNSSLPSDPTNVLTPSHMVRLCPLPPDIVEACRHFPNILGQLSVLLRIDTAYDVLKAQGVPFELLLTALTLPAVQAGFDYQRLETLGDSVLKVSTCAHLFLKHPNHHEGQLTAIKDSIVSNANLMVIGKNGPLSKLLITEKMLTRRTWRPPTSSTTRDDLDEGSKEEEGDGDEDGDDEAVQVTFHTKSLADCTEATLGAAYLSLGIDSALQVGQALGLPIGGTVPWRFRNLPTFRERTGVPALFAPVEEKLGYRFINDTLVIEAFTHTAYDPTKGPSYNRLEFLGDSLIDLYVLEFMYKKFDKMTPGQMSWARSRLVNCTTFGKLGVELGLHKCILTSSVPLQKAITSFAAEVEDVSLPEILRSCWKIDAPKPISDVFEAIFGAVFVDTSFDLQQTFTVIHRVMSSIMQFIIPDMPGDPTSELVRWVAGQGCEAQGSTIFRSSASTEKMFGAKDTVETVVHGRTIAKVTEATAKIARPKAAQATLDILKDNTHEAVLKRAQLATNGPS